MTVPNSTTIAAMQDARDGKLVVFQWCRRTSGRLEYAGLNTQLDFNQTTSV